MKRILALILAVYMAFALCACGGTSNGEAADAEITVPSEEIFPESNESDSNELVNAACSSITIGTEVFTFGMSVQEVYAAASKIGITNEVEVGGLLSSGDNYIVTGSIFYNDNSTDLSFGFSAKAPGDLNIESEEALKQALLESGTFNSVKLFGYDDESIEFRYLDFDRNVTIDEVEAYMTEQGFESVQRYDHSVECYAGDVNVLFGFNEETPVWQSIMLHD